MHSLLVWGLLLLLRRSSLAEINKIVAHGLMLILGLLRWWLLRLLLVLRGDIELLGCFLTAEDGGDGENLLSLGLGCGTVTTEN